MVEQKLTENEVINILRQVRYSSQADRFSRREVSLLSLAREAGLHPTTLYRMARGTPCSWDALNRVATAIVKLQQDRANSTLRSLSGAGARTEDRERNSGLKT